MIEKLNEKELLECIGTDKYSNIGFDESCAFAAHIPNMKEDATRKAVTQYKEFAEFISTLIKMCPRDDIDSAADGNKASQRRCLSACEQMLQGWREDLNRAHEIEEYENLESKMCIVQALMLDKDDRDNLKEWFSVFGYAISVVEEPDAPKSIPEADSDVTEKMTTLINVLTEFMNYEALFLDKLRRFIEDYQNNGGKIGVSKRYCAIVNGKLCKKYVSTDGTAPERSVRTEFFDDENPGKAVFWVPIHILDPDESEVVEAMSDYFMKENNPKIDGVFVIEDRHVTRVSDDWMKRE